MPPHYDLSACIRSPLPSSALPLISDRLHSRVSHPRTPFLHRLISSISSLHRLDVRECGMNAHAAASLAAALSSGGCSLRELELSGNHQLFASWTAPLPVSFIESALSTRVEYEASLHLPEGERRELERSAAANARGIDGKGTQPTRTPRTLIRLRLRPPAKW